MVSATGLTEGQYIRPFHEIFPIATDDVAPLWVQIFVDGKSTGDGFFGRYQGKLYGQVVLADSIPDGAEVEVGVRVQDAARNWSEFRTTRVIVDRTVPTATVLPDDDLILAGRSLTLVASDVPADSHVVMTTYSGRELARATSAPWKLPLNTADLAGGDRTVRVSVIDRAGNRTDYYRFLDIDLTGPEAALIPEDHPGLVGPGLHVFQGEASDRAGVARSEWWIDGALRGREPSYVAYDFGTRARTTAVEWRVWDRVGNRTVVRYPVTVDVQAPTVVSTSPAANTRVRGTTLKATLKLADQTGVYSTITEGGLDHDVTAPYTATFRLGADGPQRLGWVVSDHWNNSRRVYQTVIVDNSGPSVAWVTPSSLVRGSRISSSIRASDPAGVAKAQLSGAAADTAAPYASSIAAGKDGKKTLTWTVWDKLGNRTVVKRSVIVDNTAPSVKVTKAPKNKAKVKGTVKVTAAASDRNGVARVELLVNGKVVAKDTKAAYRFSVSTKKYGKKIKIQLRAYDKAGNVSKTSTRTWYRS
ncbi:hypothetical protein ACTI_24360 [Actinoplanes sp. OR16]|nr:hypothetical protein ACTI_24360 [Actinoplanes sp. OR16]